MKEIRRPRFKLQYKNKTWSLKFNCCADKTIKNDFIEILGSKISLSKICSNINKEKVNTMRCENSERNYKLQY